MNIIKIAIENNSNVLNHLSNSPSFCKKIISPLFGSEITFYELIKEV